MQSFGDNNVIKFTLWIPFLILSFFTLEFDPGSQGQAYAFKPPADDDSDNSDSDADDASAEGDAFNDDIMTPDTEC